MKKVVVDASVAVKWFVPEIHSTSAARILEPGIALYAPDLIGPEFGNILWKKVRRAEIGRDEADAILKAFERVPLEIRPYSVLIPAAFELAVALDRSVYDCLYLALAVAEDCPLITADAKFHGTIAASTFSRYVQWVEATI